jgi:hypothetical protein
MKLNINDQPIAVRVVSFSADLDNSHNLEVWEVTFYLAW